MPPTQFVQEYAVKRQQQMERARQLRDERATRQATTSQSAPSGSLQLRRQQQQQQQQQQQPYGRRVSEERLGADNEEEDDYGPSYHNSGDARPPPQHPSAGAPLRPGRQAGGAGHSSGHGSRVIQIAEEDFLKATQSGIITPDQSRQLWAMLSNQIIRVAPPSSHGNLGSPSTVPVTASALSALSHTSSLSSTMSSAGFTQFRGSITLDSLRQSIAQFKAEQQQQKQQQQQRQGTRPPVVAAGRLASNTGNWNANEREEDEPEDEEEEEEHYVAPAFQRRAPEPRGSGPSSKAGAGARKPEWNNALTVDYDEEEVPPPPAPQQAGARKRKPGEAVKKRQTGAGVTSSGPGRRRTSDPPELPGSRTGGGVRVDLSAIPVAPTAEELERIPVGKGLQPIVEPPPEPLGPCRCCGRTFRVSVLQKHEMACKTVSKPRRVFNMTNQRVGDLEGLQEAKQNAKYHQPEAPQRANPSGLPKWKIDHQKFQAAMKAVKMDPGSAVVVEAPDDRVPCPHCGRKFAHLTAERHIPYCANTRAKPKGLSRPIRR